MVKKILFICPANKDRSATAEIIFRQRFPEFEFDSGGTNHKLCAKEGTTPLSQEQVNWADRIYVMEEKHRQLILQNSKTEADQKITVLNIPDHFKFYQKELIKILENKVKLI